MITPKKIQPIGNRPTTGGNDSVQNKTIGDQMGQAGTLGNRTPANNGSIVKPMLNPEAG